VKPTYSTFLHYHVAKLIEGDLEFSGLGKTEEEAFKSLETKLRQYQLKGEVASKLLFRLRR
jgi:hypothetical protein